MVPPSSADPTIRDTKVNCMENRHHSRYGDLPNVQELAKLRQNESRPDVVETMFVYESEFAWGKCKRCHLMT